MTPLLFSCVGENKSGPRWYFTPTCPAVKNNVGAPLWVNDSIPTFTIAHNLQDRQRAKHFLSLASVKVRLSLKQFLQGGSCSSKKLNDEVLTFQKFYINTTTWDIYLHFFYRMAFCFSLRACCILVLSVSNISSTIISYVHYYLKVWGQ